MNFLELVNRARVECGVSGAALTTLGGTLSAESTRFKTWVNEAWREIQEANSDWKFMQRDFSFQTAASDFDYSAATLSPTPITDFENWKRDSFRIYLTASGIGDEQLFQFLEYETFRDLYRFGNNSLQTSRPVVFTVAPNKDIWLGNAPDGIYTVRGEYFSTAQDMSVDADVPTGLPRRFHMLIVYRAMHHYALFEAAQEVLSKAERHINRLTSLLEVDQLPETTFGKTIA